MPPIIHRFGARWSPLTWCITVLVIFVVVLVTCGVLSKAQHLAPRNEAARTGYVLLALLAPCILMITVLFAPLGYIVGPTGIVVNRMGPKVHIPFGRIAEIRLIGRHDLGFTLRTGGSGGFLGSFGKFWGTRLGRYHAYVTNTRDLVLVVMDNGSKTVLSPYPPDAFLAAVQQHMTTLGHEDLPPEV